MPYIDEFLLPLVLGSSCLVSKYYIIIPPSLDIEILRWVKQRITESYVVFSLLLIDFCLLTLLRYPFSATPYMRYFGMWDDKSLPLSHAVLPVPFLSSLALSITPQSRLLRRRCHTINQKKSKLLASVKIPVFIATFVL